MPNTARSKFFFSSLWGRTFIVTFVFVTFASGLFWLDFFRGYRAEVTVLIVTKPGMAETSEDVAENAVELTRTLVFYERVLADNDLIDDAFLGHAPDARKALWQKTVSVTRQRESGVLLIRAQGDTPEQAKRLARQTAQTLFTVAGFYYDVKEEIDMRIIDGPLAEYVLKQPLLFVTTSVFSGLLLTGVFFWLLRVVPESFGRRVRRPLFLEKKVSEGKASVVAERTYPEFRVGETVPWIDPQKFIPAKPEKLFFEKKLQHTTPPVSMVENRPVTHAPAPVNLPTADTETGFTLVDEADLLVFENRSEEPPEEDVLNQPQAALDFPVRGEHAIEVVPVVSDASPSVLADRERAEPSVDEYKRRLNALLAGGK